VREKILPGHGEVNRGWGVRAMLGGATFPARHQAETRFFLTLFTEHHLSPPIAAAVERLGWVPDDPAVRETTPTAARGHNLVVVAPPSPAYAVPALAGMLTRLGPGTRGLLLCPDSQLAEWGGLAGTLGAEGLRIQTSRGTARAMRRLKAAEVDLLITSAETALALHRRSALGPEDVGAVFLAWPEGWESQESLAPLMQDLGKDTQRIVCTAAADRTGDLVERYARRALTVGAFDHPAAPAGPVRTAGVAWERRAHALADLVEIMDPASAVVWTVDRSRHDDIARALPSGDAGVRVVTGDVPRAALVLAFDLPTADRLQQLLSAGEVVLLVPPGTESYVERLASPRRPVRLPGMVDAITAESAGRRATIVRAIETQQPDAAILTLAPLFERYDAAAVAAAVYQLWTSSAAAVPAGPAVPDIPATARVYVGVGKKDGATVNDLVAVLTKDVRVDRGKIGRVELRETYMLVELPAQDVERIASALTGTTIRRKRVTARVDRGPVKSSRPARPPRK
jgi:ATP-dependent RNA helicase DeaD